MKLQKYKQKFIIFFIILISFEYSKCDDCSSFCSNADGLSCQNKDESHVCPSDCKPNYGHNTCHFCNGIQSNDYYSIDSDGNCLINQCIGDKIVEIDGNLKQCTSQIITPSGQIYKVGELGDYYYFFSSVDNIDNNFYDCTPNVCKCKKYYYIETIYGKKKYNCVNDLSTLSSTNYKFYNYNTGQLFQTICPEGFKMMKDDSSGVKRCSASCIGSEMIKEVPNDGLLEYYCVDNCPNPDIDSDIYKYEYIDSNNIKKCLSSCPEGTYKLNDNKCVTLEHVQCAFYKGDTCYTSCSDVPDEGSNSFEYHNFGSKECISGCSGNNIYIKNTVAPAEDDKTCYSSCLEIPGGEYIYEVDNSDEGNQNYICYSSVPTTNCVVYYQKNDGIRKCTTIPDCVGKNKNYIINKECKDNCDGYYQIEIEIEGTSTTLSYFKCFETSNKAFADSNVKFCDTQLRKCWTSFPNEQGYYIKSEFGTDTGKYEITKECNNFYIKKNVNSITSGDLYWCVPSCKTNNIDSGKFFVNGNKECKSSCSDFYKYYYDDSNNECLDSCELRHGKQFSYSNSPICQASCGANEFYNYNSHICLTSCGADNSFNLYHKNNDNICYLSCLDIPQRGTYKYLLSDNSCISESDRTTSNCEYYYKYNGLYKCASASDCDHEGYKYLINSECSNKCNNNEYKFKKSITTGTPSVNLDFMKCLSSLSDCNTEAGATTPIYYHENLRMCWTEYQTDYFYKSVPNTGDSQIELVNECDNFYYVQGTNKYCTPSCKEKSLYYIKGNNKCGTNCFSDFQKHYFNPSNYECLDTCKDLPTNKYDDKIIDAENDSDDILVQPCKSECDNYPYHDSDSNICINQCGDGDTNKKYHANGDKVCYSSCSLIPGGQYIYESDFICYISPPTDPDNDPCPFYYINTNGIKQCTTKQDCIQNKNYKYFINKECKENCDGYYKLEIEEGTDRKDTIRCFETLDKALNYDLDNDNIKDIKFYDVELKQCWLHYPSNFFIKYENKDNPNNYIYEVVERCDKYYYEKEITPSIKYNYCIENCQKVNLYFSGQDKKCDSCTEYYDPTNNECLHTCLNRNNLEYAYPTDNITPQKCLNKCPYYFETKKNPDNTISAYECVDTCENDSTPPKFINPKTKECLTGGCESNQYPYENLCYPECTDPSLNYINTDTNECVLSCPSNLKNIIKIITVGQREISLCKTSCKDNQFRLEDKCLEKCPPTHKYIGNNKICHRNEDKCNGDPNGEKYFPINAANAGSENDLLYNCTDSCDKAIIDPNDNTKNYFFYTTSEPNECLLKCVQGYSYYLQNEHECQDKCPENFPFFIKDNPPSYHWQCNNENTCTDPKPYYLDGVCATITDCINKNKKFIDSEKRCLSGCKNGEIKQKNFETNDGSYLCKLDCLPYYEDIDTSPRPNPECVENCPEERNFIGKDNKCKRACDEEDGINFYEYTDDTTTSLTYKLYKCCDGCKPPHSYREINNGKQCYENCEQVTNYPYKARDENLCYDNCLKSNKNPFTTKDPADHEDICSDKCEEAPNLYYGADKICRSDCSVYGDTNIMGPDYKCVATCLGYSSFKFTLRDKCAESCDAPNANESPRLIRYSPSDYICKEKCGRKENIVKDGKECTSTCEYFKNPLYVLANPNDPNDYVEYECIESCINNDIDANNKFYYESDKICINGCKEGDKAVETINRCIANCDLLTDIDNKIKYYLVQKIDGDSDIPYDMCVTQCPEKKPYIDIDNSECLAQCPETKRYYIKEFTHGEEDIRKKCLNDCPKEYPYYTIRVDQSDSSIIYYECQATCSGFIVPNVDTDIKAKRCLDNCPTPNEHYYYKIINEEENKKYCYEQCPDDIRYHYELDSTAYNNDNKCFKQCPETAPYHKNEESECYTLSELKTGFVIYNEKKWTSDITSCPSSNRTTKVDEITSADIRICSDTCLEEFGIYKTPYNTCVRDCQTSFLVSGKNLINDEYNKECVCENLYYIHETTHELICVANSIGQTCETAIPEYPIPLVTTRECLKKCSDNRITNPPEDKCYKDGTSCSTVSPYTKLVKVDGKRKCDCVYKFYYDNNNKKTCLDENDVCPEHRKKYFPDKKQCIEACPSDYYTFKNYCLKLCPGGSKINEGDKTCNCGDRFRYQKSEGNYECLNEGADCLDSFPLYSEDNECLKSCRNTYYPYYFEDKCYDKCEIDNSEKVYVPNGSPLSSYARYKCDCLRPWYYELDSGNKTYKMHCPGANDGIKECKDYGTELINMIEETRQCLDACPLEYHYLFNELCFTSCEYANNKYTFNIETEESSLVCNCQNLWHKNMTYNVKKICYKKTREECPIESDPNTFDSYLIFNTKQCVDSYKECPTKSFKFNHICYDKCPEFTLEGVNGENDDCKCDKSHLWLKYERFGNIYYKCGLDACPETSVGDKYIRKILLESENQCVRSCTEEGPDGNDYLYSFRLKCVKECPTKTKQVYDACLFYDVQSPGYVDDLVDLKEKANIQAKELYEEKGSIPGFIMNDFGASLQIYALNKSKAYRELAMQSNLTYIDLGTCLDKIYAANNLNENDNILVTKYDLLSRTHKSSEENNGKTYSDANYLINQVEYEFYLQKNNEKIEGSICSPYEIEISYPIFYNKNKYDNYQLGINNNHYLKQFMIGKELHSKNEEIDTFNKNNKVYRDICTGVEINGKDLVYEDRYNYLYPNNVSLCESNCTMKNTDFDLQRINCMCTYKEIIDFKRIDEDINDILNDPNFDKPTQSSANAEIIKCITKIGLKEGLIKNEAFYYCAVCSVIILVMSLFSAFSGVKGVGSFVNGLLKMNGDNNIKKYKQSNGAVNSTNRLINNPPKKGEINETIDDNIDYDKKNKNYIVVKKSAKLNHKNDSDNISDGSIFKDSSQKININYGMNIKRSMPKIKNSSNYNEIKKIYREYKKENGYVKKKAEFIPPQFNFKFFKPGDMGVVKKIPRSEIPFQIDKDTEILLEGKKGIEYDEDYLEGPYYEDQNIIEIIDDDKKNNKNNEVYIYNKKNVLIFGGNNKNYKNMGRNYKSSNIENNDKSIQKKSLLNTIDVTNKEFIKIKKINPISNLQMDEYKTDDEIKDVDHTTSLYNLVKREHTFLRGSYEKYLSKNHPNILATLLAEILDKIYLIKIFIFLKKFEILSIQVSLYLFYHILVLSLLCGFFTIHVIKKIWKLPDYPTINFYLLYGVITHIIIWIIYRIFILVLDNQDKIRALVKLNNEAESSKESSDEYYYNYQKEQVNYKYEELMKKIKIQTAVFYLVIIPLTALCFIYLVSFFAIYTGTKRKVFKAYYISLIEIVLIKFVYGLSLGSLRIAAERNELKSLYNFVYIFDKYIS